MRQVSILTLILTIGCTNPKQTSDQKENNIINVPSELIKVIDYKVMRLGLTDTTTNQARIEFINLTDESFASIKGLTKRTNVPLTSFDSRVRKLDSCLTFRSDNGRIDSLCNKDDGEYFEKYSIKGIWQEKNLLLVNFQNWEERHDFLINLSDGSHYLLTPFYEVSPSRDIIISYVDISSAPIYSSELLLTKVDNGKLTTILQRDLGQTTITDAFWVSNRECLITAGIVDDESDKTTDIRPYLIRIN
jgi:hypothetical protein